MRACLLAVATIMSRYQNHDGMVEDPDCLIKVISSKGKRWSNWIPGKTLGTEVVEYPALPNTPIFLVEYFPANCTIPQRGWFNPALGAIWWRGQPEPTISYRESKLLHKSLTNVRVVIDSQPMSARHGSSPEWCKATFKPAGLGEEKLTKGVQVEEGCHKGEFFTGHTYFCITAIAPSECGCGEGRGGSGAGLWDDHLKSIRHKAVRPWTFKLI